MKKWGRTHCTRCGSNNRIIYNEVKENKCLTVCKDCKTEEYIVLNGLPKHVQNKYHIQVLKATQDDLYNQLHEMDMGFEELKHRYELLEEENIYLSYRAYRAEHSLFHTKFAMAIWCVIVLGAAYLIEWLTQVL